MEKELDPNKYKELKEKGIIKLEKFPDAEKKMFQYIKEYISKTKELKDFDLILFPNRLNILGFIEKCYYKHDLKGVSITDISNALGISYVSTFKNLNLLENKGYVKSWKEPSKNRTIYFYTKKGSNVLKRFGLADDKEKLDDISWIQKEFKLTKKEAIELYDKGKLKKKNN